MPKLPNVTDADIVKLVAAAEDLSASIHDVSGRIEKGYADEIAKPVDAARAMVQVARAALELQVMLSMRSHLQEQEREIAELLKKRAAGG